MRRSAPFAGRNEIIRHFPRGWAINDHHHPAVQFAEHHETGLLRPPSAGVLPPQQRTPKRDPSGLEDEIAVGKSLEALFFVPFKILVAVRRYPKPINRRHSIERVIVADEAVEAGDAV